MPSVRRLTAILAADVKGYSRLMGADEEGTHERLKAHLGELVNPKIAEHRGRIVKNTGDGFLAEFASVVDAVRCAVEMQHGMAERNASTTSEKRIEFRIGVNLGDVIAEEHDIFGDDVNVAARLEALAEPGGICISGTVRDHVGDRLPYAFEDMGEQQVKNIARPVRVYAIDIAAVRLPGAPDASIAVKSDVYLAIECHLGDLPAQVPSQGEVFMLPLFYSPGSGGEQIGLSSRHGQPGSTWQWFSDQETSQVYRCEITNYGQLSIFNVEIKIKVSFQEVRTNPDNAGSISSGQIIYSREWPILIAKIDVGSDRRFVFYAYNHSKYFVTVELPQLASYLMFGENTRRESRLLPIGIFPGMSFAPPQRPAF